MKKNITVLFAIIASLFICSCGKTAVDSSGCFSNIDDAVSNAQKKNQDILVVVTMCGDDAQSQNFVDTIIRDEKFKNDIASNYSVVRMDFSQSSYEATVAAEDANDTAKKNAEKRAQTMQDNTQFANLLNVSVTPMVYILSKEEYLITSIYYDSSEKSYEGFKALLEEKKETIDEMHKMIYQTKIGTPEEKMNAIDALFEATAPDNRIFLTDLLASAKKIDPNNKSGILGKITLAAADSQAKKALNSGDFKTAVTTYLSVENEPSISPEDKQQSVYTAAYIAAVSELEENSVVIEYLQRAIDLAPDSEEVPAIKRVMDALAAQ